MKALILLFALAFSSPDPRSKKQTQKEGKKVAPYLVQYADVSTKSVQDAQVFLRSLIDQSARSADGAPQEASNITTKFDGLVRGFAGHFSDEVVEQLKKYPAFATVEPNPKVSIRPMIDDHKFRAVKREEAPALFATNLSGNNASEVTASVGTKSLDNLNMSNLGCFKQNNNQVLLKYYIGVKPILPPSYETCAMGCNFRGFKYAGAASDYCYCDNNLGTRVASDKCASACPFDSSQQCGDSQDSVVLFGPKGSVPTTSAAPTSTTTRPTSTTTNAPGSTATTSWDRQSWGVVRIQGTKYASTLFTNDYSKDANLVKTCKTAAPVDLYVLDTGVFLQHDDFKDESGNSRASWGADFSGGNSKTDGNGHGTHVASGAAGLRAGLAKNANIIAVKILGDDGSGSGDSVIGGMNWVAKNKKADRGCVVNMSIGSDSPSSILDQTAKRLSAAGCTVVVAAGNEDRDACGSSPAAAGGVNGDVITVGATGYFSGSSISDGDRRAYYSNVGRCVDVFLPGSLLRAASNQPGKGNLPGETTGTNSKTQIMSGTSMASPKCASVAALLLSQKPNATPAQVKAQMIKMSIAAVSDVRGSPNRLVQVNKDKVCSLW